MQSYLTARRYSPVVLLLMLAVISLISNSQPASSSTISDRSGLCGPWGLALDAGGDDIELAEFLEVPLTTFHQPTRQIGARAAEVLIAKLSGSLRGVQHHTFAPTLVVRKSSGCSR